MKISQGGANMRDQGSTNRRPEEEIGLRWHVYNFHAGFGGSQVRLSIPKPRIFLPATCTSNVGRRGICHPAIRVSSPSSGRNRGSLTARALSKGPYAIQGCIPCALYKSGTKNSMLNSGVDYSLGLGFLNLVDFSFHCILQVIWRDHLDMCLQPLQPFLLNCENMDSLLPQFSHLQN